MNETTDQDKTQRHRSPGWPFIPLSKAVVRASEFYKVHRDHGARPSAANVAWGMKVGSGAGAQTIAALKQYGLMQDVGDGVKLTDLALRIVRDSRAISPERDAALREAADSPTIFAEIHRKWPEGIPSDPDVKFYLVHERSFSEDAAKGVLANYKATVQYSKLGGYNSFDDTSGGNGVRESVGPLSKTPVSVRPMENERVVFTHEIEPGRSVRVLVSGEIDEPVLAALDTYIELQKRPLMMNKIAKLQEEGFVENPRRESWFNRERRMSFSHEALREMDLSWLDRHLAEEVGPDDFVFHLNKWPTDPQNCIEILKELNLANLRPNIRLATFSR